MSIEPNSAAKADIAAAITRAESAPDAPETLAMLDAAWATQKGFSLGLTGPPGVGKSTLTQALVESWAARGLRVAVLAIDPSSKRSGGSLLGDRTRMNFLHLGSQVFTRSMAAGQRLGGLSDAVFPAMVLLRAVYDRVLIETVGVGQSETEIAAVADKAALCIQPASGDSLQFMKSGIAEIPDVVFVTKADLGGAARRAYADMRGALSLNVTGKSEAPVLLLSAKTGQGIDQAIETVEQVLQKTGPEARRKQLKHHQIQTVQEEFGRRGLAAVRSALHADGEAPFQQLQSALNAIDIRLADED
ncbi:MAG: methylmalonyl Co-A mutase-associated GTPase MeaB [Pseudomonadota bacterium]